MTIVCKSPKSFPNLYVKLLRQKLKKAKLRCLSNLDKNARLKSLLNVINTRKIHNCHQTWSVAGKRCLLRSVNMPSNKDVNGILKTQMENQKHIEREVFFFQLEWYNCPCSVYLCLSQKKMGWIHPFDKNGVDN